MSELQFNYLVALISLIAGPAAFYIARVLQDGIVKHRTGQPITWTTQCGDTIEPKQTKHVWIYILLAVLILLPVCAYATTAIAVVYVLFATAVFMALSMTDIKYRLIPNSLVLALIGIHVCWMFAPYLFGAVPALWINLRNGLIGMAFCFAVFFGGALLTGGKVGMGDVKLSMAIGFMLGFKQTLIAIALSGICMIPFVFTQQGINLKERFKQVVPFGPPFSLSALIVLAASFTPLAAYMQL